MTMFAVRAFSLTLFLRLLIICPVAPMDRTGLELVEPQPGSKSVCLGSDLTFRCTTSGRGDTLLAFHFERISVSEFRFRHSRYTSPTPNQDYNDTRLDDEIRAGNLLLSECEDRLRGVMDNCYTTSLVILATNVTTCGEVVCSTVFNNGTGDQSHDFGMAVIARKPPQPTNLRATTRSHESLTLTWEAGTSIDCGTALTYEVTTNNQCGNCPPSNTTRHNSITCKDLVPGLICNVSIRSMLECEVFSDPIPYTFRVPGAPSTRKDNRIALGVGVGISLLLLLAIALIIGVLVGILFYVKRRSRKRYDVRPLTQAVPTLGDHEITAGSEGENGAKIILKDSKDVPKDHMGDISIDRRQLLPEAESSLNETKVDSEEPVEDLGVNQPQLLPPPPDPNQSITSEAETEIDEKQSSSAVAAAPEQASSIVSTKSEGQLDGQEVGGTNTDAFQPSIQSIEESTEGGGVKEKPAALVTFSPGVKTIGGSSQQEDTGGAAFREMPIAMLPSSVQAFSSSAESGKQSTNSLASKGDNVKPDNGHEQAPNQTFTEGGRPLSQDSELTPKDDEGDISAKKPVALSEDGPSQAIAINGKGTQKFTNVPGSCPADVPVILKRVEERLASLETNQLEAQKERKEAEKERKESKTKIEELTAQISQLSGELEEMKSRYAALEKQSEAERQRHHKEVERLTKLIGQLEKDLAAERAKVKWFENENKMPRKALSSGTNTLAAKPGYQRTTSCPAQTQ